MLLHLTNGSAIIPAMRDGGISGRIVPWDDVLHEGPVPAGLNAAALRDVRAAFLATWVEQPRTVIEQSLRERDETLERLSDVDEIVLWFEHDLYDQLQLVQVLDRLAVIAFAKRAGFSLDEIKVLLRGMGGGRRATKKLATLAERKLPEVEAAIRRLEDVRRLLQAAARCECPALSDCVAAAGMSPSQRVERR